MASTTKSASTPKKSKTTTPKAEPVVPPVKEVPVSPPVAAVVPENGVVPLVPEVNMVDMFVNMNKMVHDLSTALALLKGELRTVERQVTKQLKVLDKISLYYQ